MHPFLLASLLKTGTDFMQTNNPYFGVTSGITSGLNSGLGSGIGNGIAWGISGKNIYSDQLAMQLNNQLQAMEKQYGYNSALSGQSYQQGLGLQNNQTAQNLKYDKESYSAKMEGLKAAGLNPMMMYGAQNTQQGGVSGTSAGGNSAKDLRETRKSSMKQFKTELNYLSHFMKTQAGKSALKAMKLMKELKKL